MLRGLGVTDAVGGTNGLESKRERPVALGTTGLPFKPAWVCGLSKPWCVGGGFDQAAWRAAGGPVELGSDVGACSPPTNSGANLVHRVGDVAQHVAHLATNAGHGGIQY